MILWISGIAFIVAFIVFLYLGRGRVLKIRSTTILKIPYIFSMSMMVGLLVFLLLWRANNYNMDYFFKYKGYESVELVSVMDNEEGSYWGDTYEFILIYEDGEKIMGFLNIKEPVPFKTNGEFTFFLKDINGETLYTLFWSDDFKRGKELLTEFISDNFTTEEIRKVIIETNNR